MHKDISAAGNQSRIQKDTGSGGHRPGSVSYSVTANCKKTVVKLLYNYYFRFEIRTLTVLPWPVRQVY